MIRVTETFPSQYPSFKPSSYSEDIERRFVICYRDVRAGDSLATAEFWLSSAI
jgi:hypothetical protein